MAAPQAEATQGGFNQRGVVAEATADDAVAARERGMIAAQRNAYTRLASEMGLPTASDRQIEAMVDSVVVEEERTTRTTYTGRLTVNFNPERVQAFAGRRLAAAPATAPRPQGGSQIPATYLEVTARYASLAEWLDVRRRLLASGNVAQVDVLAISTDQARLRLGLRAPAAQVATELMASGLRMAQGARPGEGWRVGLAGRV
ncbi:hypothetical protein ACQW02_19655 [Humitalea sp. 24SJ18S-53]|uniref:hypothetical protein n=1 Tax=Humitalea sp. 24SJ18S-53 TaxID=3422307 RepID=UPI003D67B920